MTSRSRMRPGLAAREDEGAAARLPSWALAGIAAALVALSCGPAVHLGLVHDDRLLLGVGARVARLSELPRALWHDLFWLADGAVRPSPYWRPTVVATYFLEYALAGGRPYLFHLGNLVTLAALAVVAARHARDRMGQLVVLAVLLLHPMQSEVAANITARTDTLAALFGTLALFQVGVPAAVLTLLALGSKEVAIVLPVLALVRARVAGLGRAAWLPHALAALVWLVARQTLVATWPIAAEDRARPSLDGVVDAGARVVLYLGRIAWPAAPTPARLLVDVGPVTALLGWVLLLLLLGGVVIGVRRSPGESAGRAAPDRAPWPLGLSTLVLPLLPVSGLLVGPVRYAEGFLCWPLVGLAWLLAGLRRGRLPLLLLLLALAPLTRRQVATWRDPSTLWESAAARYPDDPLIALKLARVRLAAGDLSGAQRAITTALRGGLTGRARREASAVAARLRIEQGDSAGALPLLAIAAVPEDVEATWALTARCVLEVALGGRAPSNGAPLGEVCAEALRRSPEDPDLENAVGVLAARSGDLATAEAHFARAVELAPGRPEFQANLDRVLRARRLPGDGGLDSTAPR